MEISIIGLGFGDKKSITLKALEVLKKCDQIYLRTTQHTNLDYFDELKLTYKSFDYIYEKKETFREVYDEIANTIIDEALKNKNIAYCVPGSPSVAEDSVVRIKELSNKNNIKIRIYESISFIEPMLGSANYDPINGMIFLNAEIMKLSSIDPRFGIMISQVWNSFILSDVKLQLSDIYPDDYEIFAITDAGLETEKRLKLPIFEIDRKVEPHVRLSLFIPPLEEYNDIKTILYDECITANYDQLDYYEELEKIYISLQKIKNLYDQGEINWLDFNSDLIQIHQKYSKNSENK